MVKNRKLSVKNTSGFTLIEVVLVLAIGGLIFLLAFLAFQQTSRNRRDTQRRTDVRRIAAEIESFYQDNGRLYPSFQKTATYAGTASTFNTFQAEHLNNFNDPTTKLIYNYREPAVDVTNMANLQNGLNIPGDYTYITYWRCLSNTSMAVINPLNSQKYAIAMKLERGFICIDNDD